MLLVIPMAGQSRRFFQKGYTIPKYMISLKGKTLFEYSLESLPLEIFSKIVFIGLEEHENKYKLGCFLKERMNYLGFSKYDLIMLEEKTRGQAETVYMAQKEISLHKDLVIYNIDTSFRSFTLKNTLQSAILKQDGILGAFDLQVPSNKWSFAQIDIDGRVTKTTEKIPISQFALTGLYHFSLGEDFLSIVSNRIKNNIRDNNEFYIAPMYNDLIQNGKRFVIDLTEKFIPLGTPEDLEAFQYAN